MPNMNNCQICGNLVRDPEIKNTSSGKAVATMTVAVNRYFVNQMGGSYREPAAERNAGLVRHSKERGYCSGH